MKFIKEQYIKSREIIVRNNMVKRGDNNAF